MTNEELKKKIIEILEEGQTPVEYDDGDWGQTYFPTNEDVADALIAAGIGDISKWQLMSKVLQNQIIENSREEKHRAERAERAFSKLVHEMYEHGIRPMCDEKFFVESRLKDAEKELAEEKKDD